MVNPSLRKRRILPSNQPAADTDVDMAVVDVEAAAEAVGAKLVDIRY